MPIAVKSIEELKKLCMGKRGEFFILLNHGIRSSKDIEWLPKKKQFRIINSVDDSKQLLTEKELDDKERTNIGVAITRGAFFSCECTLSKGGS